ncbi:hypothetical protein GCM10007304_12930 [Rhodococcoides trifolii]|uniref:Uncharacterized protein n=1 Tax=Rhodococcoides trifolii TaxID=908250 RepID=A0A917CVJ3_9NOCA|nr:hypothetical protein [Rhodococcus trifolii]GGG00404.1 hypothetical protein GCM10007304_12930 [Rhodococcus trifolii]
MNPTYDSLTEYNNRVARSLDAYRRRERAKASPSRPSIWQRLYYFVDSHTHTPTHRQVTA